MLYTVYRITNTVNDKCYVGCHQTNNLHDGYMGSGKLISLAIAKYGLDKFRKEILSIWDTQDAMFAEERRMIEEERPAYNIALGGKDGSFAYLNETGANHLHSNRANSLKNLEHGRAIQHVVFNSNPTKKDAWRKALSESQTRYQMHNGNPFAGKTHTSETKIKMSESSKGHGQGSHNSQYGTMWITDGSVAKKVPKALDIPDGWRLGRK